MVIETRHKREKIMEKILASARPADKKVAKINKKKYRRHSMDNYTVVKVVGKGTFGRAILVKHKTTNKNYIIKQVKLHNL